STRRQDRSRSYARLGHALPAALQERIRADDAGLMNLQGGYPTWRVEDGRLVYCSAPEDTQYPDAKEIWMSVFAERASSGQPPWAAPPAVAIPDLRFSRFPAEPALLVTGNLLDGLLTQLVASVGAAAIPLRWTASASPPDQVVIDGCWYPIDAEGLAETVVA